MEQLNYYDFFKFLKEYESRVEKSLFVEDTGFISNLLYNNINLLIYAIYASTSDYNETCKKDMDDIDSLKKYNLKFNDMAHIFNPSLIMHFYDCKIYEVCYYAVNSLMSDIKFILSNTQLKLSPDLNDLFRNFLQNAKSIEWWYRPIDQTARNLNKSLKDLAIKVIKESDNDEYQPSNIKNYYINYYKTLCFCKLWIEQYKDIVNKILSVQKN